MPSASERVIEFYAALFERIFIEGGEVDRLDQLRARAVRRQVEEAADAASQTLTRFFAHQQFSNEDVRAALAAFGRVTEPVTLARVADPNANAESLSEELLEGVEASLLPGDEEKGAIHRLGLQTLVRDLMLVGQVVAQWQRLSYSTAFELPRRVVARLNETSRSMESLRGADFAAADERFELSYRDYLLQRFNWVEAGTVRMTTNLRMDLRELFVPPYVVPVPPRVYVDSDTQAFLPLDEARKAFGQARGEQKDSVPALEQVRRATRNVLIGVPGSGKSTFLEWLQVQLASGEEVLRLGGEQAIPILLRVRQLDARNLPRGAAIVEAATASKDRARVMPRDWVHRQMGQGRVLFILDGLDEIEPGERDAYLFPWLGAPRCAWRRTKRKKRPGARERRKETRSFAALKATRTSGTWRERRSCSLRSAW